MPSEMHMAADVVGPSPTLVVHGTLGTLPDDKLKFFLANPADEHFLELDVGARRGSSALHQSRKDAESECDRTAKIKF